MALESGMSPGPAAGQAGWRANRTWRALSLTPFGVALAIPILPTSFFHPMLAKPPDILGVPLGLVVESVILGWAAIGAVVIWMTRSQAMAALALLVATAPAVVIQLILPALILIMENVAV